MDSSEGVQDGSPVSAPVDVVSPRPDQEIGNPQQPFARAYGDDGNTGSSGGRLSLSRGSAAMAPIQEEVPAAIDTAHRLSAKTSTSMSPLDSQYQDLMAEIARMSRCVSLPQPRQQRIYGDIQLYTILASRVPRLKASTHCFPS